MVGEQLQRNAEGDGRDGLFHRFHADDLQVFLLFPLRLLVGKDDEFSAAGADFLQVGFELVQQGAVGGDGDDGYVFVHQRQGAVLELACRIGLGVDVGDLLELERAFEGDGELFAPAEEQGAGFVGELFGDVFDRLIQGEDLLDAPWQGVELLDEIAFLRLGEAASSAQGDGEQQQGDELGGEGLGGGYADLCACAG